MTALPRAAVSQSVRKSVIAAPLEIRRSFTAFMSGSSATGSRRLLGSSLDLVGLDFLPVVESILECEYLAHVVADGGQGVGGGLGVLLAGVADQYQGAVLTIEGGFHGGLARSGVAVYSSVHVNGYGAGNMAFGIVGGLTDVNDDVVGVAEDGLGLIGGHIWRYTNLV